MSARTLVVVGGNGFVGSYIPRGMVIRIVGLGCAAQTRSLAFAFPFNAVIAQQVLIHPPGCARDQSQRSAFKCAETMRFVDRNTADSHAALMIEVLNSSTRVRQSRSPSSDGFLMGGWKARGRLVEAAVLNG